MHFRTNVVRTKAAGFTLDFYKRTISKVDSGSIRTNFRNFPDGFSEQSGRISIFHGEISVCSGDEARFLDESGWSQRYIKNFFSSSLTRQNLSTDFWGRVGGGRQVQYLMVRLRSNRGSSTWVGLTKKYKLG